MSREQWWHCDGCGKRAQCDFVNQAEAALAGWIQLEIKIRNVVGHREQFEKIELNPTCCSTACVGAFLEKYAKEFEGQLEFVVEEPKKGKAKS